MTRHRTVRATIYAANAVAPVAAAALAVSGSPWLAVGTIGAAHAMFMGPTLWPQCPVGRDILRRLPCTNSNRIWLTIDDGPDPEDTEAVLDTLEEFGAHATFFLIGERVAQHPELARKMVERGHSLGNHTMTHPERVFWAYGPGGAQREVARCQQVIEDATGAAPRWFRAPVGFENPFVSGSVERCGLRSVAWSVRGYDGVRSDPQVAAERIVAQVGGGDIVLMHQRRPQTAGTSNAPLVLRRVLEHARNAGLRVEAPPEVDGI